MKTSQQVFWQWFSRHQEELFGFEADCEQIRERLFDELHGQLTQVHPDLVFEFGPKSDPREFVISADGLREAFAAVSSLVAAAPMLNGWTITAFRPRRTHLNHVEIGGKCVKPEDVEFSLLTNGSSIGLKLFIPGFSEKDSTLKQIAYLMLDEALGEFDVETKFGLIQMFPRESPPTTERHPLPELPFLFDELELNLTGRKLPA